MATAHLSTQILRPILPVCGSFRRVTITEFPSTSPSPPTIICKTRKELNPRNQQLKWARKLNPVEQSIPPKPIVDVEGLVSFLHDDLPHLFDDQGIDPTAYDEQTSVSTALSQAGPYEITTRWILSWALTQKNGKFCSHVDFWDSTENNEYFSLEGLWEVFRQLRTYKTPDLETPRFQIPKRTANYEVRKYAPFIVVETNGDKLSGSTGFNAVAGYIFGKNSTTEEIPMTTPVFIQALDPELSDVFIQIVLPLGKVISSLPDPNQETVNLRKMGRFLARYNDPGQTWSFRMRNEVLIWLEEFSLD
ncbi:haem-binding protein 5 [Hibiscus trionum]|uniref:Haem-binding protein 5 n=1 Tax=Hibiscus trionum TaxID=183268 RepID=A0A9W7I936_HIBTR|nr:haem-binding protein 5 [Hibiscus trionum]